MIFFKKKSLRSLRSLLVPVFFCINICSSPLLASSSSAPDFSSLNTEQLITILNTLMASQKYVEAVFVAQEFQKRYPKDLQVYMLLVDLFIRAGAYYDAVKEVRRAEELYQLRDLELYKRGMIASYLMAGFSAAMTYLKEIEEFLSENLNENKLLSTQP